MSLASTLRTGLAGLVLAAAAGSALAFPERPVTLVVPNAAGGAADSLARGLAEELAKRLKQPVLVENVGGASGALGAQRVLRAAPDGLERACLDNPEIADLVRLAIRTEYAEARWLPPRSEGQGPESRRSRYV